MIVEIQSPTPPPPPHEDAEREASESLQDEVHLHYVYHAERALDHTF